MINGFIFDLDVIVNTEEHHYKAWKEITKLNIDFNKNLNENLKVYQEKNLLRNY